MSRVIIVGGGICGLQLGALLSSDGEEVVVLEKLSRLGGRAFIWKKDGFSVENGIHLIRFGPQSATAKVFNHLNKPLAFKALGKSYVGFPDGKVVDFPTSPKGFLTTKMMSIGERLKAIRLMVKLRSQEFSSLLDTSVMDWMEGEGFSGGLRNYLVLVSASMQVCPFIERSSAGEMLMNMQSVLLKGHSTMYPIQGWEYIYDTLIGAIKENGEIRTEAGVKSVRVENSRAIGVELESGERLEADQVVVTLPAQEIFHVIDESLVPEDFSLLCKGLKPTSGVSIDYGLKRKVSSDDGLWYFWKPMSFGMFTSNMRPETAPPGKQLLTWFFPAELSDIEDETKACSLEKQLEQAIFKQFPELENAIEWRRALYLKMVDGVEVNVDQHRGKRPGYRVPGIGELFLAGDSLKGSGAGGDIGHESVLGCYKEMTGRDI
jgi:phytoene dehydrogenase-like protein